MMLGAVSLVFTMFPWINPKQYYLNASGGESLWFRFIIGGGATTFLFGAAFFFNRRAR